MNVGEQRVERHPRGYDLADIEPIPSFATMPIALREVGGLYQPSHRKLASSQLIVPQPVPQVIKEKVVDSAL